MNHAKEHLPFLDGIRGVAILAVFLYHSLGASFGLYQLPWEGMFRDFNTSRSYLLLYPFTYGFAGVAVFFVVSGFCIHLSYQRSSDKGWACFFNRRFFRIYPPYLLAICVFFFVWPWGSLQVDSLHRLAQLVSHVLAIHNLDQRSFYGINPSFWSLAVEIQLYVIYPLLMFLTIRLGWRKGLMIVGIVEILIRMVSSIYEIVYEEPLPRFITGSPFSYWLSWSLGAYLAECYLTGRTSRLFSARFGIVAAICFLLPLFKPTNPFTFLSFSWLTAIAIERLMTGKWLAPEMQGRLLRTGWSHLSFLGVVSYSFYLFHEPIIGLTGRALGKFFPETFIHPLVKYAICMAWYPFILIMAYIIYRLIEQPSIRLGKLAWDKIKSNKLLHPTTTRVTPSA